MIYNQEPFHFDRPYGIEYQIFEGDFLLEIGIIFIFTPFIWMVLIHFITMIYRSLRIRKNAIIKRSEDYIFYRGDLDKVSPSLILFTSTYDLNLKKAVSSTIMKLKLTGHIEEKGQSFVVTSKNEGELLESEKMVLNFIKTGELDNSKYKEVVEKEVLQNKYIRKNHGGIYMRLLKIAIAICIPIAFFAWSFSFDKYVFDNYHIWPEKDGKCYIYFELHEDIKQLEKEVINESDFYSRPFNNEKGYTIEKDKMRVSNLQYSPVRKAIFFNLLNAFTVSFASVIVLICLYVVIQQIRNFKKTYTRTAKGRELLNKAYALKNYLKEYSLIKNRTEEELVLWEYYLVYAVLLDVNVKIEDKVIDKYVKKV